MLPQRWPLILEAARAWRYAPALLAAIGLGVLYQATGRSVEVAVDGEARSLFTHARTSRGVLRELGLTAGPSDDLSPEAMQPETSGRSAPALIELRTARPVLLRTAQELRWFDSPQAQPANILRAAGIWLFPGDSLLVDGLPARFHPGSVPEMLEVRPAQRIQLRLDGALRTILSAAPTLGEALWENGLVLYEGDSITPAPGTPVKGPMRAQVNRAHPLQIALAQQEISSRSAADTVGMALAQIGIPLTGLDYSIPAADQPMPNDGHVRVVRVREIVEVEQQPLPFEASYQPVEDLEIDQRSVIQAGAYGVSARRIRVRLEDGQEISRSVEGQWIAQQPRQQILGYGTQIQIRSMATEDGTIEYWRAVQMYATSYSASRAGVSPDSPSFGITASGKPLRKGLVAIDRSLIPFGTMMYVPGYGYAEAADTGGGVRGRWIDLGYDDDNYVPWSRYVTVYFLTPVPPASNVVWIFP